MLKKKLTKKVYDCKANDLLTVVADVKSYADFIPFCSDVDIYDNFVSKELEYFSACLFINFKLATENFETKVVVNRKLNIISITGNTKPFRSLIAKWSFIEKENFCEVTFSLDAAFTSYIKEKLVAISFEKIAVNIIDAFESKAKGKFF
ncbi:MAG: SRPBCC family protein [Paracoccaceae bacterium]|tara:strand:+ start:2557 stop:3003 length:447 start_codon:yes stop_codon:yes gene_type:complete